MQNTIKPELHNLVKRALKSYPSEEGRILRGASLADKVSRNGDGYIVDSNHHLYAVSNGQCGCMDVVTNHPPGGRCKHRWAVAFYIKANQPKKPTEPMEYWYFYATRIQDGAEGFCRIGSDNSCNFGMGNGEWSMVDMSNVQLHGRTSRTQAEYAPVGR